MNVEELKRALADVPDYYEVVIEVDDIDCGSASEAGVEQVGSYHRVVIR